MTAVVSAVTPVVLHACVAVHTVGALLFVGQYEPSGHATCCADDVTPDEVQALAALAGSTARSRNVLHARTELPTIGGRATALQRDLARHHRTQTRRGRDP